MRAFLFTALVCLASSVWATTAHEAGTQTLRESRALDLNQKVDFSLMWKLLKASKQGALVKDLILVCYDSLRDHVGSSCRNQAAELRACGINVHVVDDDRSADRLKKLQELSKQVGSCAPIIAFGHGHRSRPNPRTGEREQVFGNEPSDHFISAPDAFLNTRDVLTTFRGLFPHNPILLQSCFGGVAVTDGYASNVASACEGNSVCYNAPGQSLLPQEHVPQGQLVLRELLCSRAVFQALSKDGKTVGARELQSLYLSHPDFHWSNTLVQTVTPEQEPAQRRTHEEWIAAERRACPDADRPAKFCLNAKPGEPCPVNFSSSLESERGFDVDAKFKSKWDESMPAEMRERFKDLAREQVLYAGRMTRLETLEDLDVSQLTNYGGFVFDPHGPPGNCGRAQQVYIGDAYRTLWRTECQFSRRPLVTVRAKATCLSKAKGVPGPNGREFPVFSDDFKISECR